ncbi:hypothetical protein ASD8599_01526 [Ascidiaceihabitans donghaensis]|uniref:Uncharacterized protein n=1 Tax=Ascidiaceihabitans donghaensis TaxID=1510460 RepID=A0A2R8BCI4_9RHOB|nr:hypothetical protein ASD8599_01526 [Ascidiaceihabitans donghaensis]
MTHIGVSIEGMHCFFLHLVFENSARHLRFAWQRQARLHKLMIATCTTQGVVAGWGIA